MLNQSINQPSNNRSVDKMTQRIMAYKKRGRDSYEFVTVSRLCTLLCNVLMKKLHRQGGRFSLAVSSVDKM